MKHLITIQKDFLKYAMDWEDESEGFQRKYLHNHPKSKKHLQGNWTQKNALKQLRYSKYSDIKSYIESNFPHQELSSDLIRALYNKKKIDHLKSSNLLQTAPDFFNKIIADIQKDIDNAYVDTNQLNDLYDHYKDLDVSKIKEEDFISLVESEHTNNLLYNNLLVSLQKFVNTDSNVPNQESVAFINSTYSDILKGDLKTKVDELLSYNINDVERKQGTYIPNSDLVVEELSDQQLWEIYFKTLNKNQATLKDYEKYAVKYINEKNPPHMMPYGKYKSMGWSAQKVIKNDKSYSRWLSDKISEKQNRSGFENWFLQEYANEYLL